jgi:hypothetical protein
MATEVFPCAVDPGDHPAGRYETPGNSRVALVHGAASWPEGADGWSAP